MPVGKRIYLRKMAPDFAVMEQLQEIPASNIADVMGRSCAMSYRIHLMSRPVKNMVGAALTVKCCSGDNLLIHKALEIAKEGDVIVVSNEGGSERSLLGEVMASFGLYTRKIAGIVVDGPIRDIDAIRDMPLPVYATGTNPGGPYKEGPGEINVPISCGNISVEPGDILVGDEDGVIVIPRRDAKTILEAARKFKVSDERKLREAISGELDYKWAAKTLEEKEFEIIDGIYPGCVSE